MMRTLQDELKQKKLAFNNRPPQKKKKPKGKYLRGELEELIEMHRPTYTRKNEAIL